MGAVGATWATVGIIVAGINNQRIPGLIVGYAGRHVIQNRLVWGDGSTFKGFHVVKLLWRVGHRVNVQCVRKFPLFKILWLLKSVKICHIVHIVVDVEVVGGVSIEVVAGIGIGPLFNVCIDRG